MKFIVKSKSGRMRFRPSDSINKHERQVEWEFNTLEELMEFVVRCQEEYGAEVEITQHEDRRYLTILDDTGCCCYHGG